MHGGRISTTIVPMKMLIGIPAYNEATIIGTVLKKLPRKIKSVKRVDILVLNDGSTDNTSQIAYNSGAIILNHIINRGLGGALKTIFEYAKKNTYEILVTIDADGQHSGNDIPSLIDPIIKNRRDVTIGVRWKKRKLVPLSRLMVNYIANLLTYLLCGIYTTDSQSGMRAFNKKAIKCINIQTDGMEVSSEIFREIKNHNLRFSEIPIDAIYTKYSKTKGQKISDAPDVLFRLALRLIR